MNTKLAVIFSIAACSSAAFAATGNEAVPGQTVTVPGVLIGPIAGPGGATTGLAIYDHLNGNLIAEVRDNTNSRGRFVVDPCSESYQPVLVTGHFEIENLGPMAPDVKVLEAQSIEENGPALLQDISSGIADGLCPLAQGHDAFLNLEAAYPGNLTGSYSGVPCTVTVSKTSSSLTVEIQSSKGGIQSCTLDDNDSKLSEHKSSFDTYFSNGAPGTFATPDACGVTTVTARGQTIVFISTPDDSTASCTLE